MADLPKIISVLEQMTEEELGQLNHLIVARLRMMRNIRAHNAMMTFHLGQRVQFTTDMGQVVRGTLTRHNAKSVTVMTDCGHSWRVSPTLVRAEGGAVGR